LVLCYLGLGSNVGDRAGWIGRATACLAAGGDIVLKKVSGLYVTKPWGRLDQADFLNAVAEVETHGSPRDLLTAAKAVERGLGRVHRDKWGPREIDIDILLYGNKVVEDGDLVIPHPMLCERAFVLVPLLEIAPDLVHPRTGIRVEAYLREIEKGGHPSWTGPTM
jgi:2-amino-4-hydroxy-6-hydroxymethyldihydropteridine diphosphokinase